MLRKTCLYTLLACLGLSLGACTPTLNKQYPVAAKAARNATFPHQMALHQDMLLKQFQGTGAIVRREDVQLRIIFPRTTNFKGNSSVVNKPMQHILEQVAKTMLRYPYTTAEVQGFTDSKGHVQANQALSERRSHAVIAYLESQGIPQSRFTTVGYAAHRPKGNNRTAAGRHLNRRVEIVLQPVPKKG